MVSEQQSEAAGKGVPAGFKLTEVGVIPEDWEVKTIGQLNPFITSGSRGWADFYVDYGDLFVRITNMSRNSIYLDTKISENKFVSLPATSTEGKRTQLNNGDVLISITADIGIIGYVDESIAKPAYINQHISLVRFDNNSIDNKFVAYFLASENVQKKFLANSDVGAKAGMNLNGVRSIIFALPTIKEQSAIAEVLTDIDALIVELKKALIKKQAIKTATMQQLLTGKTRLPQFSLRKDGTIKGYKKSELGDFPEDWKISTLGDFISRLDAGVSVNSVNGKDIFSHGKKILKTSCVSNGNFYSHEAKSIVSDDINRAKITPKKGCIIISRMNTPNLVGELGYVERDEPNLYLPDRLWQMNVCQEQIIDNRWLAYILSLPLISNKLKETATGTSNSMKNISKDSLYSLSFPKPPKEEQTAIASILSDMDEEIQALQQHLDKTRQLKQGMMQELLTGKTRIIKRN